MDDDGRAPALVIEDANLRTSVRNHSSRVAFADILNNEPPWMDSQWGQRGLYLHQDLTYGPPYHECLGCGLSNVKKPLSGGIIPLKGR